MASQDWLVKDFYAILGVPQDADDATIKKTYRKLARKLHPDQNANDTKAEERFKEIGEAYSVLSDHEQRREKEKQESRGRDDGQEIAACDHEHVFQEGGHATTSSVRSASTSSKSGMRWGVMASTNTRCQP